MAAGLAGAGAKAETVTLKPVADTSLFERFPDNNLGRSWLAAGRLNNPQKTRALVRFDLSGIPGGAVINAATVNFRVVKSPSGGPSSTFELRRVLQPWTEGTKGALGVNTGAAAAAGEATWKSRGAAAWATAGGLAGTDYAATASATKGLSGTALSFATSAGLVADVQDWVNQPGNNQGWILISQAEGTAKTARRFGSRETANNEPTLVVDYTISLPAQPPQLVQPARVGDNFEFQFLAEANRVYTVEFSETLLPNSWQFLKTIPATASAQSVTVSDPIASPHRLYRVQTP